MENGKLVYSREKGFDITLFLISSLFPLLIIILFAHLTILSNYDIIFLGLFILIIAISIFTFFLLYSTLKGFNFKIYEHAIMIKSGVLSKQKGQADPITISDKDILKILYINGLLNIYWKDPNTGKVIRNIINGGRAYRKMRKEIITAINNRGLGPYWHGPKVYNAYGRIRECFPKRIVIFLFIVITIIPALLLISPLIFLEISGGAFSLYSLYLILFGFFTLWLVFAIVLFPLRIKDKKSYKFHGTTFSIQGGFMVEAYTEYRFEDIESIEETVSIPLVSSINPKRYKFYDNPYSAKNCPDIYYLRFKEDYELFERGEYIRMKDIHPSYRKKFQHLTIPVEVVQEFRNKGAMV